MVLSRLGARRSAWNRADIRGEVERLIAATGLVTDAAVRIELAEDLTHRAAQACVPLLKRTDVPEHVRALSSPAVLEVEADLVARLARRAGDPGDLRFDPRSAAASGLDGAQGDAVGMLAARSALLVVEGAAGSGKTRTLAAAHAALAARGHRMVVVTPTLKAAQVARQQVGEAFSAAWLAHQHGWRWDQHGSWTRIATDPGHEAVLRAGDLIVVDEVGMLDQDTARALLTIADEAGARLALIGDRHQLPAVGRGGVLDLALRWTPDEARTCLDVVHRFADPEYATLTLAMRTGTTLPADTRGSLGEVAGEPPGEVFDALHARGHLRVYATETERTAALADAATAALLTGAGALMMADTRDQVAALNGAIRDRLITAGQVDDTRVVCTTAGERLGVGDRIATRRNDRRLGVANRDTWTITEIAVDGCLTVNGKQGGTRTLTADYVAQHVELAYATTVYGAQGETTSTGHLLLGEHTTGSAAYVGMTRGRETNIAHLVAEDLDQARALWQSVFHRDPADLGPGHAALRAAGEVERYGPLRPLPAALASLRAAWTVEQDLREAVGRTQIRRDSVAAFGDPAVDWVAQLDNQLTHLTDQLHTAHHQVGLRLHEPAIRALPTNRLAVEHAHWRDQHEERQAAQAAAACQPAPPRTRHQEPTPYPMRAPDRGRGIGR